MSVCLRFSAWPAAFEIMLKNNAYRFGLVSKLLHWLIALGIIGLIWLGWWMVRLGYYDPWYHDSLQFHQTAGMLVLLLAFAKICWQLGNRLPLPGPHLKPWQIRVSKGMHYMLYALMILVPVTGYMTTTSSGQGVPMFGLFEFPALLPSTETSRDVAIAIHYYVSYVGIALILGHAGAALKHHFINKDDTLKRMTWGKIR